VDNNILKKTWCLFQ